MRGADTEKPLLRFKLAWNFDAALIGIVARLNKRYSHRAIIDEVFGSLPDGPAPSARPTDRLPRPTWKAFTTQVRLLREQGISFNYLVNTVQPIEEKTHPALLDYIRRLADAGVHRFTVGSPDVARLLKSFDSSLHLTMSLCRAIRTVEQIKEAEDSGVDAIYLSGPHVNRNFPLLRELLTAARVPCGLYANVSCLSRCPELQNHYNLFAQPQTEETLKKNDAFFAGCSLVKLNNPVEWIQMPWIRPEDVPVYAEEGADFFKLADRLATTPMLQNIADSYLSGDSPEDFFPLIERNAAKFKPLLSGNMDPNLRVWSKGIPDDFIEHFRSGECVSMNTNCDFCRDVASQTVDFVFEHQHFGNQIKGFGMVPDSLQDRSGLTELHTLIPRSLS